MSEIEKTLVNYYGKTKEAVESFNGETMTKAIDDAGREMCDNLLVWISIPLEKQNSDDQYDLSYLELTERVKEFFGQEEQ